MRLNREKFNRIRDDVMSNFDHAIDKEIEIQLKNENVHSGYAAWNFHGNVWYENEKFHCEIWQYGNYQETISSETLEEIMSDASSSYGSA